MAKIESDLDQLPPMFDAYDNLPAGFEVVFLGDGSTSMDDPVAPGSRTTRREVLVESFGGYAGVLGDKDAQAKRESAEAGKPAGGVMTYMFSSDGREECLDDLRRDNYLAAFRGYRWGGSTNIVPAWKLMLTNFREEFKAGPGEQLPQGLWKDPNKPEFAPKLLVVIYTDGELNDQERFLKALSMTNGNIKVAICVTGYNNPGDNRHDDCLNAYLELAKTNHDVRVIDLAAADSAQVIGALESLGAEPTD